MFDWDDSELANILWDEGTENSDHIVPYPKGSEDCQNKKESKEHDVAVKPNENEEAEAKVDLNKKLPESHDGSSSSGLGIESWTDLPRNASNAACESVNNNVPNNSDEITKYDTARGTDQRDEDSEIYQSSKDGKEQGDFVDYSWANIGSFYDFDRIFSNDEAVFGHVSLDNTEGLWPSSRNIGECSGKSVPVSSDLCGVVPESISNNTSRHLKIKTEFVRNDDLSCSLSYGETGNCGYEINPVTKEQTSLDMVEKSRVETSLLAAQNITNATETSDEVRRQKKSMSSNKRVENKITEKPPQEPYAAWSTTTGPSFPHFPSSVPQMQLIRPELYTYQHVSDQFMPRPFYGNPTNPFPAMPVMSHIQPGQFKPRNFLSSYNDIPANKSAESPVSPVTMTPQEKIEKLRRRQQLRAMLAIEKQQQQLSQQVLLTETRPQNHETDDLCSPLEQDGSNIASSGIEDYSVEETVLHRLQDVIANLDVTVRLCIRDSLFRLAQSARKRQSVVHTSKNEFWDEQEGLVKEEINSYNRLEDTETETNPTDRTIAHLLFHRPLEITGIPPESTKPLRSTKPQSESRTAFSETLTNKQSLVCQESKVDGASEDGGKLASESSQ